MGCSTCGGARITSSSPSSKGSRVYATGSTAAPKKPTVYTGAKVTMKFSSRSR